ncbi:MAG: hypothetical protein M3O24_02665 [Thermoproteota archaeon]|nr:hypothetical protein [Thermoproteota archaeon]
MCSYFSRNKYAASRIEPAIKNLMPALNSGGMVSMEILIARTIYHPETHKGYPDFRLLFQMRLLFGICSRLKLFADIIEVA